jgi:hypothetical protein
MTAADNVWAYGSLMDPESLASTLASPVDADAMRPVTLEGWRRSWNCVSVKTFLREDCVRVRRVVLGIERDPGARCSGVLIPVTGEDLARLRRREAAYHQVDVSAAASFPPGTVTTFVPEPTRTRPVVTLPDPLVVEHGYLDQCLSGADFFGLDDAAHEIRAALDLDVVPVAGGVESRPW